MCKQENTVVLHVWGNRLVLNAGDYKVSTEKEVLQKGGTACLQTEGGHCMSADRRGHCMSADRREHCMPAERRGHFMSTDRRTHCMPAERRGALHASLQREGALYDCRKKDIMHAYKRRGH